MKFPLTFKLISGELDMDGTYKVYDAAHFLIASDKRYYNQAPETAQMHELVRRANAFDDLFDALSDATTWVDGHPDPDSRDALRAFRQTLTKCRPSRSTRRAHEVPNHRHRR